MAPRLSKREFIFLLALPLFLSQCGVKGAPRPDRIQAGPLSDLEREPKAADEPKKDQ